MSESAQMTAFIDNASSERVVELGFSANTDTRAAIEDVLDQTRADQARFTFVFFSPEHEPCVIADVLRRRTGERSIAGSTAGEISSVGFTHGTMVAMSLHGDHVRAAVSVLPRLSEASLLPVTNIASDLARRIGRPVESLDPSRHLWMLLFDGLSGREDFLTPFFATHAPRLPLVGGSMGDEERFEKVSLIHDGRVHKGAGAVLLLEYDRPFEVLHHTHLEFSSHWFEVTATGDGGRVLLELDGRPAKEVYAEALGVEIDELPPGAVGRDAFGYRFKGRPFPCSIMRTLPEGLLLAYSVQLGDRLNLLKPVDLVSKSKTAVKSALDKLTSSGGNPQGMLLFNCLGRYAEARHLDVVEPLFESMSQLPIVGLNSYGEQFESRHMNHSVTGVLFG